MYYIQKPYTTYDKENNIEKSSIEFAEVEKTKLLKPGEKQTLNLSINKEELASYDSYGKRTYILEAGNYYISTGEDSHDALNNILSKKGKTVSDGMDKEGNSSFAFEYKVEKDDFETYSVSKETGKSITNQFDNADLNIYQNTSDQKMTYLSRSDWAKTYPTDAVPLSCLNDGMIKDMQYGQDITPDTSLKMPTYGASNGINLISLLYEDYDSPLWDKLLDQTTFEEQSKLTTWGSNAIAGVPSIAAPGAQSHDGPAGIRDAENSVAYPGETTMSNTFNKPLIEDLGNAMGMELMDLGYVGLYGPGANIHRNNFAGRNFEYYSEDGTLSGIMLNAQIKGLRNRGIIPFTKHFALNDQERNRYGVTVWANEQTIREVYLKAFKLSITDGKSNGLMSSFNRIGCTWSGAHKGLLTEVLRNEWGFQGMVETDAAVGNHQVEQLAMVNGVLAGQDLWMMGTDQNVYGKYKDYPQVALTIRQAAKNNLYAQLHSFAMNGIKSGTKIIEITPWWKNTITGLEIGVGIVTFVCLGMAIASFVLPIVFKKEI